MGAHYVTKGCFLSRCNGATRAAHLSISTFPLKRPFGPTDWHHTGHYQAGS